MAIESTVFPLPSEVLMPPAAYWAVQGRMNFWGVVVAGTLGSWAGSALSYFAARSLGRPLILRFGAGRGRRLGGLSRGALSPEAMLR